METYFIRYFTPVPVTPDIVINDFSRVSSYDAFITNLNHNKSYSHVRLMSDISYHNCRYELILSSIKDSNIKFTVISNDIHIILKYLTRMCGFIK